MSEGPIPWTAVVEYAKHSGITDLDEIERFTILMRKLDMAYMEHRSKERDSKSKKSSKAPSKAQTPMGG